MTKPPVFTIMCVMLGERDVLTETWVARCLDGDASAWRSLVEYYAPLALRVGLQHGLSHAEAEDIAQDAFLSLAQNLHTIEDPKRLAGWLLTTTRRLCWRAVQKRRRELPPDEADLSDAPDDRTIRPLFGAFPSMDELLAEWERQETIGQALARLSERCRRLISLLFLAASEPSYDEISAQVGIPKGSIGPTRNRCLQQLRTMLEGMGAFR